MELIERLNAAWTAAHSRALTPIAPRLLTEAVEEIERLRAVLEAARNVTLQTVSAANHDSDHPARCSHPICALTRAVAATDAAARVPVPTL